MGRERLLPDQFWERVSIPANVISDCWEWTGTLQGSPDSAGKQYGRFKINGRKILAHRFSFLLVNGEIKDGHVIRHLCSNPQCVNPSHLVAGTQKENMSDRDLAGRHGAWTSPEKHPSGERHGMARLTRGEVEQIRARHANGETQRSLAKAYRVHFANIHCIVNFKSWK